MSLNPQSVRFDPEEFELEAYKLQPTTFWESGYLELVGKRGEKRRFSLNGLSNSSPIQFEVNTEDNDDTVKVLITGFAIVCGEHTDETMKSYVITIRGSQERIEALKRATLKDRGFVVV